MDDLGGGGGGDDGGGGMMLELFKRLFADHIILVRGRLRLKVMREAKSRNTVYFIFMP